MYFGRLLRLGAGGMLECCFEVCVMSQNTDVDAATLAQEILVAIRSRKGTIHEMKLSLADLNKLKAIAGGKV